MPLAETTMTKDKVEAKLVEEKVVTEDSDAARDIANQGRYGQIVNKCVELSLLEAIYLVEKEKLTVKDKRGKELPADQLMVKARRYDPNISVRYRVFRDIRSRGYIVKTALKFGADFRVYDRGVKPGEDHAKWIVYPVHESSVMTWRDFSAKNRVAHSTKKRLMIGVADDEGDVTFYEIQWMRP
ncbi:tRNA-intron lyase [Candidatus Woesearchaeota archaeon]|nr:tRNA-intron lyase [Candidatus Woesearchaeota archaeon]